MKDEACSFLFVSLWLMKNPGSTEDSENSRKKLLERQEWQKQKSDSREEIEMVGKRRHEGHNGKCCVDVVPFVSVRLRDFLTDLG